MADLNPAAIEPDTAPTSNLSEQTADKEASVPSTNENANNGDEKAVTKAGANGDKPRRGDKRQFDNSRGRKFNGGSRRNESKYDPSTMPTDKDPQKIRAQVYF